MDVSDRIGRENGFVWGQIKLRRLVADGVL